MLEYKFFRGYICYSNTFSGATYATASIANPSNPWMSLEEVHRTRIRIQEEENRIERRRFEIEAEIRGRMIEYSRQMDDLQNALERTMIPNHNVPKINLWNKIKTKLTNFWDRNESLLWMIICTSPFLILLGFAIYFSSIKK